MRAMAMSEPGMFLSQPPMATKPSMPAQPTTVSIESAMTSRETSEYFMPSVPIEMPSEIGDGVEDDRLAAGGVRAFLGFERELVNVHVARRDVAPGGGDADERLLEILGFEADGIKHGAGGGAFVTVKNEAGKMAQCVC